MLGGAIETGAVPYIGKARYASIVLPTPCRHLPSWRTPLALPRFGGLIKRVPWISMAAGLPNFQSRRSQCRFQMLLQDWLLAPAFFMDP